MDLSVILTYRCNSKCSMCYIWQNPTNPEKEISLKKLNDLPDGFDYLNLTGGEPTLRSDLFEICEILYPKTNKLEISTNGLNSKKLSKIVKKFPDIKIRISVDGMDYKNDEIRGEKDGFSKKIDTMKRLIDIGGKDLGFATTFQDENIDDIIDLYLLSKEMKVELATSALHNGFQFHKDDNYLYKRKKLAYKVEELIMQMLNSWDIKTWFRAYLNLGLIKKILGQDRLHRCTQGTDNVFIDPWGDVYACNVRNDLLMGNLNDHSFDVIYNSAKANDIRKEVFNCAQNCWMVSSAKTAVRSSINPKLPKLNVLKWVVVNKIRTMLSKKINFNNYIDYDDILKETETTKRTSFLNNKFKKTVQGDTSYYKQKGPYYNR